jgi:predicted TIM-barrel fold metal-dependent hydrolase
MSARLDAHAHFFFPGFVEHMPENCRRQSPDEITLYQAHAQHHEITQVLAVGFEGEAWAAGNNHYLATLAAQHDWIRPVAFITDPSHLTVNELVPWQAQRFVGISLYILTRDAASRLSKVAPEIWDWLSDRAWLISVNATGEQWDGWQPILSAHPELRLLIAHLGLPPATTSAPSLDEARAALTHVTQLARFPHTYVKYSGFYALAQPGHAYPHRAAWPYAQVIHEAYSPARILWASDFSPALELVSFPQTIEVLAEMSHATKWLTDADLDAIYHDNLAHLLATIEKRNPTP